MGPIFEVSEWCLVNGDLWPVFAWFFGFLVWLVSFPWERGGQDFDFWVSPWIS